METKINESIQGMELSKPKFTKKEKVSSIKASSDAQKKILKLTIVGTTGLAILKGTLAQGILMEKAIVSGVISVLGATPLSFLGVLPIPNYLVIPFILYPFACAYEQIKGISSDKPKKGGKN